MTKLRPNDILRDLQIRGWKKFSFEAKTWIMMSNYFFAVIPGIIYLLRNVFIEDESKLKEASFNNSDYITYLIVFCLGLVQSIFQLYNFNRFMSLRLVKTFFTGQIVALILILSGLSNDFVLNIKNLAKVKNTDTQFTKISKKIGIFLLLLVLCYLIFFAYLFSPYSEI